MVIRLLLCIGLCANVFGSEPETETIPVIGEAPSRPMKATGIDWAGLLKQTSMFIAMQHGFRLATEEGTRIAAMPTPKGYLKSVSSLHGWSDGDPFYVNYVGHPMQGSMTGFLWTQNDRKYRHVEFGKNPDYWRSRVRALGFMWVYSTQFEIGPVSEASIGRIQATYPQQGLVDHVVTPVFGLGWQVAEDALDKYLISAIERKFSNSYVGLLARGWLNPTRSMANMLRGHTPWYRDTRPGVFKWQAKDWVEPVSVQDNQERPDLAPFELTATAGAQGIGSSKPSCVGAGAEGTFRITPKWQIAAAVTGCRFEGMQAGASGDSLTYTAGPRWTPLAHKRWSPWLQMRLGGNLLTQKVPIAGGPISSGPVSGGLVSEPTGRETHANGFAMAAGGGLDVSINRYASFRVASVEVTRSWAGNLPQRQNGSGVQLRSGITLKVGSW